MRTRYIFSLFLAVFFAIFAVSCSSSSSDEGSTGASNTKPCNPVGYTAISTEAQLKNITLNNPSARYYLKNDIVLTSEWKPLGAAATNALTTPFQGNFDGCGHTISNLNIGSSANYYSLGLFSRIELGYISNLHVIGTINNTSSIAVENAGLLAGEKLNFSSVDNCSSDGSITAGMNNANVGGLVGYNTGGIEESFSKATVTAADGTAGGLVGVSEGGFIRNSYALGNVVATGNTGGLVGFSWGATIINSYAAGTVNSQHLNAGGLVGKIQDNGEIFHNVAANSSVIAQSNSVTVGRVYGDATGYTGGSGNLHDNAANSSMALQKGGSTVSATNTTGSGKDGVSMNVSQRSTYTDSGWNFTTIWKWDSQLQRPVLRRE